MGRSIALAMGVLLAVGTASRALAAPAPLGTLLTTSSVALSIAGLSPTGVPVTMETPVNGTLNGSNLASLTIPASVAKVTGNVVPVTDPGAFPIAGIQVTAANGPGNFNATGGMAGGFGGVMALNGATKVCLFGPCSAATANLTVPLSVVGRGATGTKPATVTVNGSVNLTIIGAPWTTGTAEIGTVTTMGTLMVGASNVMSKLVTPIFISTNIGASAVVPGFGLANLNMSVPEPGAAAVLAAAVAGLVGVGVSRRRTR
jgi:hypothetical protein